MAVFESTLYGAVSAGYVRKGARRPQHHFNHISPPPPSIDPRFFGALIACARLANHAAFVTVRRALAPNSVTTLSVKLGWRSDTIAGW